LSKEGLNLKLLQNLNSRWRLISTPFQLIWLRCLAKTHHELSWWHLIWLK
jgi:hypothetical protein